MPSARQRSAFVLAHLREHRTRPFLRFGARVTIGEHMRGEPADRRARMFAGVTGCGRA